MVLDVDANAVKDLAGNLNLADANNVVTETADTTRPTITSALLNYANGVLVITASETIDAIPAANVDLTKIHINDVTGTNAVNLGAGDTVWAVDSTTVSITLSEAHRVAALTISGVLGGNEDQTAVVLDVDAGAVQDIAGNLNLADADNAVTETADTTRPTITSSFPTFATLNYGTGVLVITASETIDATPASTVDKTKIHINNVTGTNAVTLGDDDAVTAVDGTTVTITLSEANRVAVLAISGVPGGDGGAVVLDVEPNAVQDMAGNLNTDDTNNAVVETADTVAPAFASAEFTTNTNLDVTFFETLGAVNAGLFSNGAGKFTVTSALLDATDKTLVHVTITGLADADQAGGLVGANGLQLGAGAVVDKGVNGSALATNNNIAGDTTPPAILSATLDYGTGVLVITSSEKIDATPAANVDTTKIHIDNVSGTDDITLGAGDTVTAVDGTTVGITLSEANRVAALAKSGVAGGDGVAVVLDVDANAVKDLAGNLNITDDGNTVTETADTVVPTIISATLNYGTGVLVITASETLDVTPLANVDKTKIHINNVTGTNVVTLGAGDTVTAADGTTVTITLSEANRVAALAISGVGGGDGVAVVLDVDAGAVKDMAGNLNAIDANNAVAETPDLALPTISATSPAAGAHVKAGFTVSYTLSENVAGGTVKFTSLAGTETHTMTAGERTKGAHTIVQGDLSGITAVDGTTYTVKFDATDVVGNLATQVANAGVVYDITRPTVTLTAAQASPTNAATINMTATFDEAVMGFSLGDVIVANGTAATFSAVGAPAYTFNVTPTGDGMVTVHIGAGIATDLAGNDNTAAVSFSITSDRTAPVISAASPETNAYIKTGFTVSYTLSEAVAAGTLEFDDGVATQTHALAAGERTAGSHTIAEADLSGVVLVDGTAYTVDFNATDAATNNATEVESTTVTYDTTALRHHD